MPDPLSCLPRGTTTGMPRSTVWGTQASRPASTCFCRSSLKVRSMPSISPSQPSASARARRAIRSVSISSRRKALCGLTRRTGQRMQASLNYIRLVGV